MSGIDPSIVKHEIWTYPDAKPVRQKLRLVNPCKATVVKAEVEKLLKDGFIYPIALTQWISNLVPVDKKQGTIRVCTEFRNSNKSFPKDNYPTLFIDQIIDACARSEVFSFMDGFSGYIRFKLSRKTNIKHPSFVLGLHLRIRKFLLDWKIQGWLPFRGQWIFPFMTSSLLSNPT